MRARVRLATVTAALTFVAAPVAAGALLSGGEEADVLRATRGADVVDAKGGDDVVLGFRGRDLIRGGGGDDVLLGGRGRDTVLAGPGADVVQAGPARDVVLGQAGDDVLFGGVRGDVLSGGSGDDRVLGGRGHDTVYLGEGADVGVGGRGRDTIFSRAADGAVDTIVCGPGRDRAVVRPEDRVHPSCERVRVLPAADTAVDPGDEDALPPAATRGDDGRGEGGEDADEE